MDLKGHFHKYKGAPIYGKRNTLGISKGYQLVDSYIIYAYIYRRTAKLLLGFGTNIHVH